MSPTPNWGFSVLNSILRNLSELGLKIQQFQSDQEEVVVQKGRAVDDNIAQFYQQYLLTQEDRIHPLQGCTACSVPVHISV